MAIKNHVSCHVFSTDVYFNFLIIACQLVIKNKIMFDLHVYLGSCHNWDTEANKGSRWQATWGLLFGSGQWKGQQP